MSQSRYEVWRDLQDHSKSRKIGEFLAEDSQNNAIRTSALNELDIQVGDTLLKFPKGGDELKQFILFGGDFYYPCGGWRDFRGSYDSIEEAELQIFGAGFDWWHVVNSKSGEIVRDNA